MSFIIKHNTTSWSVDTELLAKKSELFTSLIGSGFREDKRGEYEIKGDCTTTAVEDFVTYLQGHTIEIKEFDRLFEFLSIADYFLTDLTDFLVSNENFLDTIRTDHPDAWNQMCKISNTIKQQLMAKFYIFKFSIKNHKNDDKKIKKIGKIKSMHLILRQFDYQLHLHVTPKGINFIKNNEIIGNIEGFNELFATNDYMFQFTNKSFETFSRFYYIKSKEMTVTCHKNTPNTIDINFELAKGIKIDYPLRNSLQTNFTISPIVNMKHIISFTINQQFIQTTFKKYFGADKMIIENGLATITTKRNEKVRIPILTPRIEKQYTFNMDVLKRLNEYGYKCIYITFHLMVYNEENYLKVNVLFPKFGQINFITKQV